MARLSAFTDSEQLSLDDVLAEFRDTSPPGGVAAVEKKASGPAIGADPDVIRTELDTQGDVSQAKIGTEPHNPASSTLCPFRQECYKTLGLATQHCSWNQDDPPTWRFCGGYKRRVR